MPQLQSSNLTRILHILLSEPDTAHLTWQSAWIESFNGKFRDGFLNGWQFDSLLEARVLIEDWRIDYNWKRLHTAHDDLAPSEFAAKWTTINQPQAA